MGAAGRAVTRPMVPPLARLGCWSQRQFPEMCNYRGQGQPVGWGKLARVKYL